MDGRSNRRELGNVRYESQEWKARVSGMESTVSKMEGTGYKRGRNEPHERKVRVTGLHSIWVWKERVIRTLEWKEGTSCHMGGTGRNREGMGGKKGMEGKERVPR